ncbi:MAG: GTP 3',8-cyclase MoaA [Alphaproteobacteria bacterium]|nr:GTP 3',8-cyclase MoaA [Alphaproteobacteria bacterium]
MDHSLALPIQNARPEARAKTRLVDPFGREISYVRVSVTDRCDFRCVYCMAEDMSFLPKSDILSLEELERLSTAFIDLGVRKLRLTGGEPLTRRNILSLIRRLGDQVASGALEELTLTTNGSQLAKYAEDLAAAHIRRINVSVDSLHPDRFTAITRWGKLPPVLDGIFAAKAAGIAVKLNCVALLGVNDDEYDEMIEFCGQHGFELTLIEVMPMGEIDQSRSDQFLALSTVRQRLEKRWHLTDLPDRTGGPARYVRIAETGQRLGFITPMSHNFCESCNRVRVTCTGVLYMCLGQEDAADLRAPLRASESNDLVTEAIYAAIARKPKGHDFIIDRTRPAVSRHMSVTGG